MAEYTGTLCFIIPSVLESFNIRDLTLQPRGQTNVKVNVTIGRDGIMEIKDYKYTTPSKKQNINAGKKQSDKPTKELVIENVCDTLAIQQRLKVIQRHEDSKDYEEIEYRRRLTLRKPLEALNYALVSIECVERQKHILSPQKKADKEKLEDINSRYNQCSNASKNEIIAEISEVKNLQASFLSLSKTPESATKQSFGQKIISKFIGRKKESS